MTWGLSFLTDSIYTFLSMSSGFFIPVNSIPIYLRWFQYVSYLTYSLRIFIANEFSDNIFPCPDLPPGSLTCNGNAVITSMDFEPNDYKQNFLALFYIIIVEIGITYLLLCFVSQSTVKAAAKVKPSSIKIAQEAHHNDTNSTLPTPPAVTIQLKSYTLTLKTRRGRWSGPWNGWKSPADQETTLLNNLSTVFRPGKLSAIMGSSGSGKTTLLQALHKRTSATLPASTTTVIAGVMCHNDAADVSEEAVGSCTASVRQDDSHLLPALTARETLVYAAMLRLPESWSKEAKRRRAEEVLGELGLRECGDTLVGGFGVKGLSGGEKRRLSVGLALLNDPSVLLMDEPTSVGGLTTLFSFDCSFVDVLFFGVDMKGLDSATAKNMIQLLKTLAEKGRTVICTIHQPRSDIVPLFDSIFILARGGHVVYDGPPSDMIRHFGSLGYDCPPLTNPADFAIDISSVDLRASDLEETSRARVHFLIDSWKLKISETTGNMDSSRNGGGSAGDGSVSDLSGKRMFRLSVLKSLPILISRSFLNLRRQIPLVASRYIYSLYHV
jgi:ABC-type multidrug transport system ATPase subunit